MERKEEGQLKTSESKPIRSCCKKKKMKQSLIFAQIIGRRQRRDCRTGRLVCPKSLKSLLDLVLKHSCVVKVFSMSQALWEGRFGDLEKKFQFSSIQCSITPGQLISFPLPPCTLLPLPPPVEDRALCNGWFSPGVEL